VNKDGRIKQKRLTRTSRVSEDDLTVYKFSELSRKLEIIKGVVCLEQGKKACNDMTYLSMMMSSTDKGVCPDIQIISRYGKVSKKLHITTFKYTSFWEFVRNGDPIAINILRDGVPLIDREFFRPLQLLLLQGRIRPSQEAVWNYYYKSPETLQASKIKMISAVMDLYWAVIDAEPCALMK
jgi:hypothetical protein